MGSYLTSFSDDGASMGDAASKNISHSVVSDIFSGYNCSQHDGEIQSIFSLPLSYPIFSEAHKGMEEGDKNTKSL